MLITVLEADVFNKELRITEVISDEGIKDD